MKTLLRFDDLKERKICGSWAQLARMIERCGFPPGRMLSQNTRTWTEDEIDQWYASRPVENETPLRGGAARRASEARAGRGDAAAGPRGREGRLGDEG